jgi:hypothetical protein
MVGLERNQLFSAAPDLLPRHGDQVTVLAFNLLGDGLRDALDPGSVARGPSSA